MTGRSCGVAPDQRLRQVGDHKTEPDHTQKDLQPEEGSSGAVPHRMTVAEEATPTDLEEPCQNGEGARYLDSVGVPGSSVYVSRPIGAVHSEVTVGGHPLRHPAHHDTGHSKRA